MELHQLECFIELTKFQNVSMTAEHLNISQPALSKTISTLESDLGCKLFDRIGRRIVLNERGRIFLRYAEEATKNLRMAREAVHDDVYQPAGTITIGLFSYIGAIADCIDSFLQRYPLAQFRLFSSKTQYTVDNLNDIDITLSSSLRDLSDTESDEKRLPLSREDYVVIAAPELLEKYDIRARHSCALADLRSLPFMVMSNNLIFADVTFSFCLMAGFQPIVTIQTNDFASKLHLTSLGTAAAFIPEICIPEFMAVRKDLCILHLTDIDTHRTVYMSVKNEDELSPIARAFWDYSREFFR